MTPFVGPLLRVIKESIRAVPAMKYAMAVVGLMAATAIAFALFGSRGKAALVVAGLVFVGMVLLTCRAFFGPK